jgi:hypothetical protein
MKQVGGGDRVAGLVTAVSGRGQGITYSVQPQPQPQEAKDAELSPAPTGRTVGSVACAGVSCKAGTVHLTDLTLLGRVEVLEGEIISARAVEWYARCAPQAAVHRRHVWVLAAASLMQTNSDATAAKRCRRSLAIGASALPQRHSCCHARA